jgi:hypothetical protein
MVTRWLCLLSVPGLLGCQSPTVLSTTSAKPDADPPRAADGGGPAPPPFAVPPPAPGGSPRDAAVPVTTNDGATCAEEVHGAEQVAVDLLLLVDKSGSMTGPKWDMTTAALARFVEDPRSAGLGVGMSFFPRFARTTCANDGDCGGFLLPAGPALCLERRGCVPAAGLAGPPPLCGSSNDDPCAAGSSCVPVGTCSTTGVDCLAFGQPCPGSTVDDLCTGSGVSCRFDYTQAASCKATDYDRVDAPIRPLPPGAAGVLGAITRNLPFGGTPTLLAVNGALNQLRQHLARHPDHRASLVLATDGLPTNCADNAPEDDPQPIETALQSARTSASAITTYVIGVFDVAKDGQDGPRLVDRIAAAGGSGKAFVLSPTADLTQQLTAALDQIRGAVLPCELTIPKPQTALDYGKVNVRFRAAAGEEDIPYVGAPDRCDPTRGGWYYDTAPGTTAAAPTRVLMCPATCARFKAAPSGSVKLAFGCRTLVID